MKLQGSIKVSNYWVTSIAFMTASKRLAVATSDRMVSFYDMAGSSKMTQSQCSRIENLLGMPQCLEYVEWPPVPGHPRSQKQSSSQTHTDQTK